MLCSTLLGPQKMQWNAALPPIPQLRFLCRSKSSMKSLTHQSALHLSFKIKCCVDRLRPPWESGQGLNCESAAKGLDLE